MKLGVKQGGQCSKFTLLHTSAFYVPDSHSSVSQTKLCFLGSCMDQNEVSMKGIYNWTETIRKL